MEYDQSKYDEQYWDTKSQIEPKHFVICAEIYKSFVPKTLLDYGCGMGQFVKVFNDMGVDAFGYEPSAFAVGQKLHTENISANLTITNYDVVMCMDVAEHVPLEDVDSLLKKIKTSSVTDFVAVFSICFKGDTNFPRDSTHITERTREWWEYKIRKAGFELLKVPETWTFASQMIVARIKKEVAPDEPKS